MFIIEKYLNIRFKNRWLPYYFLSSKGQKMKNFRKIEQKILLLFTFLVSFFMAFLTQRLIYTRNIWFNFLFGFLFEQDHSVFFWSLFEKMTWMCTYFKIETDVAQNMIDFFFPILNVRGSFHRKDFKWKK